MTVDILTGGGGTSCGFDVRFPEISDAEHLFMGPLVICMSPLEKGPLGSPPRFYSGYLAFVTDLYVLFGHGSVSDECGLQTLCRGLSDRMASTAQVRPAALIRTPALYLGLPLGAALRAPYFPSCILEVTQYEGCPVKPQPSTPLFQGTCPGTFQMALGFQVFGT